MIPIGNPARGTLRYECPTDPKECDVIEGILHKKSGTIIVTKSAATPRADGSVEEQQEDYPRKRKDGSYKFFLGELRRKGVI